MSTASIATGSGVGDVVHARLRVTDPASWRRLARSWRSWAAVAGRLTAEFAGLVARLGAAWSGAAATAAAAHLAGLRRRLVLFRLVCWQADQAVSEFAAALERARTLLARAEAAGLSVIGESSARSAATVAGTPAAAADLTAALTVAGRADASAADRLSQLTAALLHTGLLDNGLLTGVGGPPGPERPSCAAEPAEVRRWWAGLTPAQRLWLLATEPGTVGALDGIPAADRDAANRLLLDDLEAGDRLDRLADRLADDAGPRAYLLRLDPAGEGRVVMALGDPDRAANVLTHVPGMTAGLASFGGELSRAERVAVRATETGPAAATSAVLWLGYDAPDFLHEAWSAGQARAGAPELRRFQDGLRATHDGPPARQTVLGHSYGSLVVGTAAATPGLSADSVVFVGSPGVGVNSANRLHVPSGEVWSATSRSDVIQYLPGSPLRNLPVAGPWLAFGRPEQDLWFGRNPSDPAFGARVFPAQADGGHLGYWDRGRPALDTLAAITLGTAR